MSPAEEILKSAGVENPADIDLKAIAWLQGAVIIECPLTRCDARITGSGKSAVIRVKHSATASRKRFSVAHELGHWTLHRGRDFRCSWEHNGVNPEIEEYEREADRFASDLILPDYMFRPAALSMSEVTADHLLELARTFQTSLTATCLKIAEYDFHPTAVVKRYDFRRIWFRLSPSMRDWAPKQIVPPTISTSAQVVKRTKEATSLVRPVTDWFESAPKALGYVREVTFFNDKAAVLSVVQFIDA